MLDKEKIVGFTSLLSELDKPFFIAPGRSAKALARLVVETANELGIRMPAIICLGNRDSHILYDWNPYPAHVLSQVFTQLGISPTPGSEIPVLDDYTRKGEKPKHMSMALLESTEFHNLHYSFYFLTASERIAVPNVYVHFVSRELTNALHKSYN